MRSLIPVLMVVFVSSSLALGCDEQPAEESGQEQQETADSEQSEQDEQAGDEIDDEGQVVDDIQPADSESGDSVDVEDLEGSQWLENDHYGVKIQVPEEWTVNKSEEVVSATDPEESTTAIIGGSDSDESVQSAIDNLKEEMEFTDVEVETSDPKTLGGFPAHEGIGSAVLTREDDLDQEIQFLGYAVNIGDDQNVVLMIFSEATMYEAKKDVIDGIAGTISRI